MTTISICPFTQAVVSAVKKVYPEQLADKSFDNTGLLLEAPYRPGHLKPSVLLANDLTSGVAQEAITKKASVVIAYHPIIFRPLKSLTFSNTQQASLLRLAQEGISVYCPHTAVDAAPGGLNDWLADIVTGSLKDVKYLLQPNETCTFEKHVAIPVPGDHGVEGAGYGRVVTFSKPQKLGLLVTRICKGLDIQAVSLAVPQSVSAEAKLDIEITTVGVCAGSGGSVLRDVKADLLLMGEMSHHEALAAIENGQVVITAFHSNSERGYLKQVMQKLLEVRIPEELKSSELQVSASDVQVLVSEVDRDPFQIFVS